MSYFFMIDIDLKNEDLIGDLKVFKRFKWLPINIFLHQEDFFFILSFHKNASVDKLMLGFIANNVAKLLLSEELFFGSSARNVYNELSLLFFAVVISSHIFSFLFESNEYYFFFQKHFFCLNCVIHRNKTLNLHSLHLMMVKSKEKKS